MSDWLLRIRTWLSCWRYGHELELVEPLNMIARVHCAKCGNDYVIHRHEPGMLPWNKSAQDFFASHRLICERWLGGVVDSAENWKGRL